MKPEQYTKGMLFLKALKSKESIVIVPPMYQSMLGVPTVRLSRISSRPERYLAEYLQGFRVLKEFRGTRAIVATYVFSTYGVEVPEHTL